VIGRKPYFNFHTKKDTDMKSIPPSDHKALYLSKNIAEREAKMTASIFPEKFKSVALMQADARCKAPAGDFQWASALQISETYKSHSWDNPSGVKLRDPDHVYANQRGLAPINNMGVTENHPMLKNGDNFDDGTTFKVLYPTGSGRYKTFRIPGIDSNVDSRSGFVDQVSFSVIDSSVVRRDHLFPYAELPYQAHKDDAYLKVSSALGYIFGFCVTSQRPNGFNFYKKTYNLGENDGLLHVGGDSQRGTINVQIFGQGSSRAKSGWENRLKQYLEAVGGWITRIDLATDLFDGQYTPEQAENDFLQGRYSLTNRRPSAARVGDWYNENAGKTFQVGKRESGKMVRVYEKQKQLSGTLATKEIAQFPELSDLKNWVRVEVEFHRGQHELPLDMLVYPGKYLAGSYPAFSFVSEVQCRVETVKKIAKLTVHRAKVILTNQYGNWLYAFSELGVDLTELFREGLPGWANPFGGLPPDDYPLNQNYETMLLEIPF
jgi:phage replication initiation protein